MTLQVITPMTLICVPLLDVDYDDTTNQDLDCKGI